MGRITLEGMEFFACHGHYAEEKESGTRFIANVWMDTNTEIAASSDNIADALNYQEAYVCIRRVFEQEQYNLLETLASHCIDSLFEKFSKLEFAGISVRKINPAMGGVIAGVSICIERSRK